MTPNYDVLVPDGGASIPLIVHVPHSSLEILPELLPQFRLSSEGLAAELLAMTDRYADELFLSVLDLGGAMFVNQASRLVMDPERFPNDEDESMSLKGMGAVYVNASSGARLRVEGFGASQREAVMQQLYWPYAVALERLVADTLSHFSHCLIVDGHSFPTHPLPYEDPSFERPDVCLGYDSYHVPTEVIDDVTAICQQYGLRTAHNSPFSGSYVPLRYYRVEPRVKSLMIEVRRGMYMDESTGMKSEQFTEISSLVAECLSCVASTFTN